MENSNNNIEWEALEYDPKKRSVDWYWAMGTIAVASSVASIIFKNLLFGIFILIGVFTLIIINLQKPEMIKYIIDKNGVRIKDILYPYEKLKHFWVKYDDEKKIYNLLLLSERKIMPILVIPLPEKKEGFIKETLKNFLPEKEITEPISEKIMDRLGF